MVIENESVEEQIDKQLMEEFTLQKLTDIYSRAEEIEPNLTIF